MEPTPSGITADRQKRVMNVQWSDGHSSVYPFGLLRAGCPCASCRGGHQYMGPEPDKDVFDQALPDSPQTRIKLVEPVGTYALTIQWEDGHHFGIYTWHYLRALCPCDACRK